MPQKTCLAAALGLVLLQGCSDTAPNNIQQLEVSFDPQQHTYHLNWQASDPQQPVDVLVSDSAAFSASTTLADDMTGNHFQWQASDGVNRHYFRVVPRAGQTATASSRWLPLAGGRNFRDLGGYTTTDGQQVRWGKLFRSGALTGLTEADYQELQEVQIGTVVDFRTTEERQYEPTHWQGEHTHIVSRDYAMDMSGMAQMLAGAELTAGRVEALMAQAYPGIVQSMTPQYTEMFDRLAASDDALLFHCTAGKDRTGVAGALILTALGVDRDTIVRDFMLSDYYYSHMSDPHRAMSNTAHAQEDNPHRQLLAQLPPEVLAPLMGVRESYLQAAFAYMEQDAGSVLAYIQQRLSVTDVELQRIRTRLLEPRT